MLADQTEAAIRRSRRRWPSRARIPDQACEGEAGRIGAAGHSSEILPIGKVRFAQDLQVTQKIVDHGTALTPSRHATDQIPTRSAPTTLWVGCAAMVFSASPKTRHLIDELAQLIAQFRSRPAAAPPVPRQPPAAPLPRRLCAPSATPTARPAATSTPRHDDIGAHGDSPQRVQSLHRISARYQLRNSSVQFVDRVPRVVEWRDRTPCATPSTPRSAPSRIRFPACLNFSSRSIGLCGLACNC